MQTHSLLNMVWWATLSQIGAQPSVLRTYFSSRPAADAYFVTPIFYPVKKLKPHLILNVNFGRPGTRCEKNCLADDKKTHGVGCM